MSTEQFVAALHEYQLDPTEIAEILWLALRQPPIEPATEPNEDERPSAQEDTAKNDASSVPETLDHDDEQSEEEDQEEEPSLELAPQMPSGTLPAEALPVSVPDAGFLEETLPLVRALKPLLKQLESQMARSVNEAATVDRIAETDIWSPVLQPDREPWFDVALVIDQSASMTLWQRLIQDIRRLLRCYGSFRDFRVWELDVTQGDISICAVPDRTKRSPRALLPPDNRRLTLVFSDCTADYWWNGSLQPVLALWGYAMPTAIWQVLPDWMWKQTALGVGEYVTIRNHLPGAINKDLNPIFLSLTPSIGSAESPQGQAADLETALSESFCIPVITTDSESLAAWSRMLAGDLRYPSPGFVLPAVGWSSAPTLSDAADEQSESAQSDDPLEQFRLWATPDARRLATLLAAAPVITLPVMRLIAASDTLMRSGASPLPVAEVFLGGLLKRAPDQPESDDAEVDAERVQYTFAEEARDRLLDVLAEMDAISVIDAVSRYVAEQLNYTLADFRALLLSPSLKAKADEYGLRAFARVTAQILRKFGSEYAPLIAQLEGVEEPPGPQPPGPQPEPDDWLTDFTHQKLTYTVAEYLDFPPITDFEFTEAALIEEGDPFPPPLKPDDFKIVTVELVPPGPPVDSFDFTIATLRQQGVAGDRAPLIAGGGPWIVERQPGQANRFIENLPDDMTLEMVSIPGGTFRMGSPEGEPDRNADRESPQHNVTVPPFFMGRYPITQAQWRVIANLPQVNRELNSDPSHFKGDKRPVEQVSWHDAVEFCDRLSAHTDLTYRLPSEAEWEYACRASTTTPFHFGDMIITDVANYNGSAYADGPQGERRGETTSVDHFGIANAFGLSDMHGNVLEWCADHWHKNYEGAPTDGSAWVEGGDSSLRVYRGGSWVDLPWFCRSAFRNRSSPVSSNLDLGFRVVCSPPRALP